MTVMVNIKFNWEVQKKGKAATSETTEFFTTENLYKFKEKFLFTMFLLIFKTKSINKYL